MLSIIRKNIPNEDKNSECNERFKERKFDVSEIGSQVILERVDR